MASEVKEKMNKTSRTSSFDCQGLLCRISHGVAFEVCEIGVTADSISLHTTKKQTPTTIPFCNIHQIEYPLDGDPCHLLICCKNFSCIKLSTPTQSTKTLEKIKDLINKELKDNVRLHGKGVSLSAQDFEEKWNFINWNDKVYPFPPSVSLNDLSQWARIRSKILTCAWSCNKEDSSFHNALVLQIGRPLFDLFSKQEQLDFDIQMIDRWFEFINHPELNRRNRKMRKFYLVDCGDPYSYPENLDYHFDFFFGSWKLNTTCKQLFRLAFKKFPKKSFTKEEDKETNEVLEDINKIMKLISWSAFRPAMKAMFGKLIEGGVVVIQSGKSKKDKSESENELSGSLVLSLLLILIDSRYRTIKGYISLLFDQFSSTGRKNWFSLFCFLQNTYELQRRYPAQFEFNDRFIHHALNNIYFYIDKLSNMQSFLECIEKQLDRFKNLNARITSHCNFFDDDEKENCVVLYDYLLKNNPTHHLIMQEVLEEALTTRGSETTKFGSKLVQSPLCFIEDFSIFANITNLFIQASLTSLPDSISSLVSIKKMNLDNNLILTISDAITSLSSLEHLSLSKNKLTKLPELHLPCLKEIFINNNHISDLEFLGGCTALRHISARQNSIRHIPFNFHNLKELRSLEIESNLLSHIPGCIFSSITNLEQLKLSSNKFVIVPSAISSLLKLQSLDLSNNQIRYLPSNLFRSLSSLNRLSLSKNRIVDIPMSISFLQQLSLLELQNNKLSTLPSAVGKCYQIRNLDVSYNKLKEVPLWFSGFTLLDSLRLDHNEISKISSAIGHITCLKNLNLEANVLKKIPFTIGSLTNLETLNLKDNQIAPTNVPPQLIEPSGKKVKEILEHLASNYSANLKSNSSKRMRIMVMGQEGSGKTQLVRLLSSKWEKLKNGSKKEGLEITSVIATEQHKKKGNKDPKKDPVMLDIWDFDGSTAEVYYATHQFFLTSWSIFMLVYKITDGQAGTKLGCWIHSIASQVPDAKILLVATHTDIEKPDIMLDVNSLKQKLISIHGGITFYDSFSLSCKEENKSMDDLRNYIVSRTKEFLEEKKKFIEISETPPYLIFERLSKEFRSGLPFPVISYNELSRICSLCRIEKESKVVDLARHFHKIGSILYFEKISELKDFVILDPQWLFGVMAELFKNGAREHGLLNYQSLDSLRSNYSDRIFQKLLSLIEKFQIAFPVHDKDNFSSLLNTSKSSQDRNTKALFIPALISNSERPVDFIGKIFNSQRKAYIFRAFQFTYIPLGLFARFITRVLHQLSPSVLNLWRQGVVLEANEEGKKVKVLLEHDFYDLGMQGSSVFNDSVYDFIGEGSKNQIGIEMMADDLEFCCEIFFNILQCMITVISDTKFENKFEMIWYSTTSHLPENVPIDTISQAYEINSRKDLPSELTWESTIPEIVIPAFKGKRYPKEQIKFISELGSGGFARVFLAEVESKKVAVKELHALSDESPLISRLKFIHELVIQSSLNHPNIVAVEGICSQSTLCIIFELCSLGELHEFVHRKRERHITWKERLRILLDIANGLAYLHGLPVPILHGDMKTPNILLISLDDNDPIWAKIADFGTSVKYTHPISSRVVDNPRWLAPEILEGKAYDLTVDTYAFGIITWEMFTRDEFFNDIFNYEIEERVMAGERQEIPKECPPQYSQIIESCWAQKPQSRPAWSTILKTLKEIQDFSEEKYNEMEQKNLDYWKRLMAALREKELEKQRLEEEKKRKREEELLKQEEETLKREAQERERNEKSDKKEDKKKKNFLFFKAKKSESHLKADSATQPQTIITPPTSPLLTTVKSSPADWKSTETFSKTSHLELKSKTLIGNRNSFSEPPGKKPTEEPQGSSNTLPKLPSLPDTPDKPIPEPDKPLSPAHSSTSEEDDRIEEKKRRSRRTKPTLSKTTEDLKDDKGELKTDDKPQFDRSYSTQDKKLKDKSQKKKKRQTTLDSPPIKCSNCSSLLDPTSPTCKNCQTKNPI
eukprot:TRINITY_DN17088_c0_g1_i1.p1 TRINITY_DN17088_c0_g1~~TRINITY_DN17088_c0_g1_i1.p1  ORF type:complete len:1967 (-),score=438.86 TRINITY_DN17088_c0_g1_i1:33-5933(-)